jgi:phosphoribosylanthranilate isomerase
MNQEQNRVYSSMSIQPVPIVQIYAVTSVDEALALVELGVDHIGFVAGAYGEVHGELTFAQAGEIARALRGKAVSSALTMSVDLSEILRMAQTVRPDIVHISSDVDAVDGPAMKRLRATLPSSMALMKAIHVSGSESIDAALEFAQVADLLLLDTKAPGMPGVGATGVTHDWNISRQIVEQVGHSVKVILAGGLTPENVALAIQTAHPWGVDSNTGTNIPGDPVAKDIDRVRDFVRQAKGGNYAS